MEKSRAAPDATPESCLLSCTLSRVTTSQRSRIETPLPPVSIEIHFLSPPFPKLTTRTARLAQKHRLGMELGLREGQVLPRQREKRGAGPHGVALGDPNDPQTSPKRPKTRFETNSGRPKTTPKRPSLKRPSNLVPGSFQPRFGVVLGSFRGRRKTPTRVVRGSFEGCLRVVSGSPKAASNLVSGRSGVVAFEVCFGVCLDFLALHPHLSEGDGASRDKGERYAQLRVGETAT